MSYKLPSAGSYGGRFGQTYYSRGNYNRFINNPKFVKETLDHLRLLLKRYNLGVRINDSIIGATKEYIGRLPPDAYSGKTDMFAKTKIANHMLSVIQNSRKRGHMIHDEDYDVDTKEMMKDMINETSETSQVKSTRERGLEPSKGKPISTPVLLTGILNRRSAYGVKQLVDEKSLYRTETIVLDTRHRELNLSSQSGIRKFRWSILNHTQIKQEGSAHYVGIMRDIVSVKVLPIRIPTPSNGSAVNDRERLTLYFDEFSSQAFLNSNEFRKYQFIFKPVADGSYLELDPDNFNCGLYEFTPPITRLDKLTFSFGNPVRPVVFDIDRSLCTFATGSPTTITTSVPHNLTTGDIVIFEDFSTASPTADESVINEFNDPDGLVATVLTGTTFTVPIDTSSLAGAIDPATITCFFDSKRFSVQLIFTYVQPKEDTLGSSTFL